MAIFFFSQFVQQKKKKNRSFFLIAIFNILLILLYCFMLHYTILHYIVWYYITLYYIFPPKSCSPKMFHLKVLTWSLPHCATICTYFILIQMKVVLALDPNFSLSTASRFHLERQQSLLIQTQKPPPLSQWCDGVSAPLNSKLRSRIHYQRLRISTLQPDTTWKRARNYAKGCEKEWKTIESNYIRCQLSRHI